MIKLIAKNVQIVKDMVIATQEPFLAVTADIYEGEEFLETRKYGFSFDTPTEDIKKEVLKSLTTLRSEKEQAEKNKDRDALEKKADQSIEEITGLEFNEPEL